MPDTVSAAPSEADLEKFCDAFDWDGWTDQKAAQHAFARAALAKWGKTSPPAVAEPLTDEAITAAARVLCERQADACGIDRDDQWMVYGDGVKEDARAMLIAAHGIGIKKGEGNGN